MSSSTTGASAAPTPKFPSQFTADDLAIGLLNLDKGGKAKVTAIATDGFPVLHRGGLQSLEFPTRFEREHNTAKSAGRGNTVFGGRIVTHKGNLVGCYCLGVNHLKTADATVHVSLSDLVLHNDTGAESGAIPIILGDIEETMRQMARDANDERCLAVLVSKQAFGDHELVNQRGFKRSAAQVESLAHGPVWVYTKKYGRPKKS